MRVSRVLRSSGFRGGPRRVPLILAVPGVVAVLAVHYGPGIAGIVYAFTDWNGLQAHWIGFANFTQIFHDPTSRHALMHTVELALAFTVLVNCIGLLLALGLNRTVKSRHFLRLLFFAPALLSSLAITYIWQFIFDYRGGLNQLFQHLGVPSWQQEWLGNPSLALWMVLVVLVWQYSGLVMVIYLAGLQGVSDELIEAAAVDGAGMMRRFRKIIFPLLA